MVGQAPHQAHESTPVSALPLHIAVDVLEGEPALALRIAKAFGSPDDPVAAVERRARTHLAGWRTILWEGDPQTFQFTYVSPSAEDVLGYPCARWVEEPGFWTQTVVHPEDRNEAVAFCALATAQNRNHDFRYRARRSDGTVATLLDAVQVLTGGRGVAVKLRGLMVELPDGSVGPRAPARSPNA